MILGWDKLSAGRLIVFEGPDHVGRSTHAETLRLKLEANGVPVIITGLARSEILGDLIKSGNRDIHDFGPKTRALLYATDLMDQVENIIKPSIDAGFVVIADRYIFTPVIRESLRGVDPDWSMNLYSAAPDPDLTILLKSGPRRLLQRVIYSGNVGTLSRYESGMDLGFSNIPTLSFLEYQSKLKDTFDIFAEDKGFPSISTSQGKDEVSEKIWKEVAPIVNELMFAGP